MKITEKEFNVATGEETITERDETALETEKRLARKEEEAQRQAEAETKATAKSALLSKLGITQEEANLLLS